MLARFVAASCAAVLALGCWLIAAAEQKAVDAEAGKSPAAAKEQLASWQALVGAWRGVGQPQRGSTKDSWIEAAEWSWSFGPAGPALVADLPQGKPFRRWELLAGEQPDEFILAARPSPTTPPIPYRGKRDADGKLTLVADTPTPDLPSRLTLRLVAGGDRLLALWERRQAGSGQFVRLAEVGYTRQGSGFGRGATQRECIVTGGLGTIEVAHAGRTYYVCCTGCRDYFQANPDAVLAEYAARKAESQK